jgi:hypothetical protein
MNVVVNTNTSQTVSLKQSGGIKATVSTVAKPIVSLTELSDVTIGTPNDHDILMYDAGTGKFQPRSGQGLVTVDNVNGGSF